MSFCELFLIVFFTSEDATVVSDEQQEESGEEDVFTGTIYKACSPRASWGLTNKSNEHPTTMLPRLLTLTFLTFALAAPTPPAIWELDPFIQRLVDMDPSFYDRYIVSGKIDGIAGLPMPGNSTVHYPQVATTRAEYESYQALTKRKIQPPTRRQVSQMPANPATTAAVAAQALWNRDTGTSYKDVKQSE